jgi:two-component sensor histidine kinase
MALPQRRPTAIATRVARLDFIGRRTGPAALARQLAVAAMTLAVFVAVRAMLDAIAPGVGPFTPLYPLLIPATLLGRLPAGLVTWAAGNAYVAKVVLPSVGAISSSGDVVALTVLSLASTLFVVLLTEAARSQSAALLREREGRIRERDMLLLEVDHRLKNNLAMLSGLLALQLRETDNDEAREVLARAGARLQSLARVYDNLRYEPGTVTVLDAAVLVERLCGSLGDALGLDDSIALECAAEPVLVTRDRASALALLINEVVTNAAKHAFAGRNGGRIRMELSRAQDGGAVLSIADDGRGIDPEARSDGRGRKLLAALAEMAGGELSVESGWNGTTYRLRLRQLP